VTMTQQPCDVSGIWKYDWSDQVPDARAPQFAAGSNMQGPHGTYTRIQFFVFRVSDGPNDATNQMLDVLMEDGTLGRFIWDDTDSWVASTDPVTFAVPAGNAYVPSGDKEVIVPSLVLGTFTAADVPSDAEVGTCYVHALTDPAAGKAQIAGQRITFEPDKGSPAELQLGTLRWLSSSGQTLYFKLYEVPTPVRATTRFDDVFQGDSKIAQVSFPFCGFNPVKMRQYDSGASSLSATDPGTPRGHQPGGQSFPGGLIFQFPSSDSHDAVRSTALDGEPFLPLGLDAKAIDSDDETTHTTIISSVDDRMSSWSMTLGFSAGIEKVFSVEAEGGHEEKLEDQVKNECRYVVTREVGTSWALLTDLAAMQLHEQFKAKVGNIIGKVLDVGANPKSPSLAATLKAAWDDFTQVYGTHYAHVLTQGSLTYSETRFTLQSEVRSYLSKTDVKASASATIEGLQITVKTSHSDESSDKNELAVSNEDATKVSIGSKSPLTTFFDLRPMAELFSPLFFRLDYAEKTGWGAVAPLVWRRIRKSFVDYMEKRYDSIQGATYLGAHMQNYTPRKVRMTVSSLTFDPTTIKDTYRALALFGKIVPGGSDGNEIEVTGFDVRVGDMDHCLASGNLQFAPKTIDSRNLYAVVAAKTAASSPVNASLTLDLTVLGFIGHDGSSPVLGKLTCTGQPVSVTLPTKNGSPSSVTIPFPIADTATGLKATFQLLFEDLGPLWPST
jgi:hypothetical protein